MRILLYLLLLLVFGCSTKQLDKEKVREQPKTFTSPTNSVVAIRLLKDVERPVFTVVKSHNLIPRGRSESKDLILDKKGNYFLQVVIDRPVKAQLYIGKGKTVDILLVPNDTTMVDLNFENYSARISYDGKYKQANSYYEASRKYLGFSDLRQPFNKYLNVKYSFDSIKNSIDSITSKADRYLAQYKTEKGLPEWFVKMEHNDIVYSGASFKHSCRFITKGSKPLRRVFLQTFMTILKK